MEEHGVGQTKLQKDRLAHGGKVKKAHPIVVPKRKPPPIWVEGSIMTVVAAGCAQPAALVYQSDSDNARWRWKGGGQPALADEGVAECSAHLDQRGPR